MADEDAFFKSLLDSLYDPVYYVSKDMTIAFWNRSAEQLTGYSSGEVVGSRCSDNLLVHVDESGRELCLGGCPLAAVLQDGVPREADVYLHHKDGHRVPVSVRTTPVRDASGAMDGAIEIFSDRTSKLAMLQRIQELERSALLCPLTGIGNRRYAEIALNSRFDEFNRYGWEFGVIMLDIDHFKRFNDEYGHATGDMVLRVVAGTVADNLRSFDFVGRWGGEEFVIFAPNVSAAILARIAERCRDLIAHSFVLDGNERLNVTASFGATLARCGDSPATIVDRADKLMYRSKSEGRNRVTCDAVPPEP